MTLVLSAGCVDASNSIATSTTLLHIYSRFLGTPHRSVDITTRHATRQAAPSPEDWRDVTTPSFADGFSPIFFRWKVMRAPCPGSHPPALVHLHGRLPKTHSARTPFQDRTPSTPRILFTLTRGGLSSNSSWSAAPLALTCDRHPGHWQLSPRPGGYI